MSDVSQWNITDGSNNSAAPDGWPEGQAPSTVNNAARANMGALARWFEDTNGSLSSTGSANAYLLAAKNTITALADCPILVFQANFGNTGSATLKVDSLTAKTIKKNHDQNLVSGDIENNQIVVVAYNATDDTFELISGALGNLSDVVDDTSPTLGGNLAGGGFDMTKLGTVSMTEQAAANADVAADGQWWVRDNTPNLGMFTNDAGTDFIVGTTLGAEVTTTSGTTAAITGIPSGVKKITIMFEGVSTDGTEQFLLQLGDAGGVETSSYISTSARHPTAADTEYATDTNGFVLTGSNSAGSVYSGIVTLYLKDAANNTWILSSILSGGSTTLNTATGSKSLSAEITQLLLTTDGTPDTFDAGSIAIQYE